MSRGNDRKSLGYIRVSTDKQADNGMSLEVQQEKIQAMAVVHGLELSGIITDAGESAKSLNRPGVQRVMAMVRKGEVETVIVAKLDRLTRSVMDLGAIVELFNHKRVNLISVQETLDTGTAAGRMMMNVLATVAQWERETISERTTEALTHRKRSGLPAGNIPYGFASQGAGRPLIEEPNEQACLARMRQLRDNGLTFRGVTDKLNEEGYRTRRGSPWRFQYVAKLLTKEND